MKVKGGARRKSWEALPVSAAEADLPADSNHIPPNHASSSALSLFPLHDHAQQQPHHHDDALDLLHSQTQPQPHPHPLSIGDTAPPADVDVDDDDDDDDGDADDDDAEADANDNTERSKLDEGFYEIEAIRRKRVRKVLPFSHHHHSS